MIMILSSFIFQYFGWGEVNNFNFKFENKYKHSSSLFKKYNLCLLKKLIKYKKGNSWDVSLYNIFIVKIKGIPVLST